MTTGSYERWRQRLAGEKVMTYPQPDENDIGFYRKPITTPAISAKTGERNGRNTIIGWEPVAYYMHNGQLCGAIGDRDMTADEIDALWTFVCRYAISEDEYLAMTGENSDTFGEAK